MTRNVGHELVLIALEQRNVPSETDSESGVENWAGLRLRPRIEHARFDEARPCERREYRTPFIENILPMVFLERGFTRFGVVLIKSLEQEFQYRELI